jgi:hypothetical protein
VAEPTAPLSEAVETQATAVETKPEPVVETTGEKPSADDILNMIRNRN